MGIYVSIACVEPDLELEETISSAIGQAAFGDLITVGVAIFNDKSFYDSIVEAFAHMANVKLNFIEDPNITIGKARVIAASMIENQDYFLNIHSHTQFIKNWDVYITSRYYDIYLGEKNKRIILTGFPAKYFYNIYPDHREEVLEEYLLYPHNGEFKKLKEVSEQFDKNFKGQINVEYITDKFIFTQARNLERIKLDQDTLDYKEFLNNGLNIIYPGKLSPVCHYELDSNLQMN